MSDKVYIRVVMDGPRPTWELMHEGVKICDLSFVELVEHAAQAASACRWVTDDRRGKK